MNETAADGSEDVIQIRTKEREIVLKWNMRRGRRRGSQRKQKERGDGRALSKKESRLGDGMLSLRRNGYWPVAK